MIAISCLIVCSASLVGLHMHHRFRKSERDHKDVNKLATALEVKIASMDELKKRMESLLLRNGLGRQ